MTADDTSTVPQKRNKKRERGDPSSNKDPETNSCQLCKSITEFNIQTITVVPESRNACRKHPESGEMKTKSYHMKPVHSSGGFAKKLTPCTAVTENINTVFLPEFRNLAQCHSICNQ